MIGEVWRIVLLQEVKDTLLNVLRAFPVAPEPLRGKAWHAEHAKVDEDADLAIVIPLLCKEETNRTKISSRANYIVTELAESPSHLLILRMLPC